MRLIRLEQVNNEGSTVVDADDARAVVQYRVPGFPPMVAIFGNGWKVQVYGTTEEMRKIIWPTHSI